MDIELISPVLTWLIGGAAGLGILFVGLGYGYGQFMRGARESDNDTINSLERRVEDLTNEMTGLREDNKELIAKNNQLQGQLQTYKEIATLQNPEFKEVIKKLAETVPPLVQAVTYCQSQQKLKLESK